MKAAQMFNPCDSHLFLNAGYECLCVTGLVYKGRILTIFVRQYRNQNAVTKRVRKNKRLRLCHLLFCVISDGICGNSGDGGDGGDGGDDGCGGDDSSGDDGCGGDDSSGDVSRRQMRDWQQVDLLQKALLPL
jgi:uncharacterized membrane protein YgcG